MPTFDSDKAMTVCGVSGRLTHRTTKPGQAAGLWFHQRWISEPRPLPNPHEEGAMIRAELRFDDDPSNGRNTFAITGNIFKWSRNGGTINLGGDCVHDEIAAAFPELAHLIPWHLTSTDGPMHYVANAVHFAGDRDQDGLRAGEERPLINGRTKRPMWELVAVTGGPRGVGVAISTTPTGLKYQGAETVPLFTLEKSWDGEEPPATPVLEWRRMMRRGEGKARELDSARRAAVWPEATDDELSVEPAALTAALAARLPALIERFRADMAAAGFYWSPEDWIAEHGEPRA